MARRRARFEMPRASCATAKWVCSRLWEVLPEGPSFVTVGHPGPGPLGGDDRKPTPRAPPTLGQPASLGFTATRIRDDIFPRPLKPSGRPMRTRRDVEGRPALLRCIVAMPLPKRMLPAECDLRRRGSAGAWLIAVWVRGQGRFAVLSKCRCRYVVVHDVQNSGSGVCKLQYESKTINVAFPRKVTASSFLMCVSEGAAANAKRDHIVRSRGAKLWLCKENDLGMLCKRELLGTPESPSHIRFKL